MIPFECWCNVVCSWRHYGTDKQIFLHLASQKLLRRNVGGAGAGPYIKKNVLLKAWFCRAANRASESPSTFILLKSSSAWILCFRTSDTCPHIMENSVFIFSSKIISSYWSHQFSSPSASSGQLMSLLGDSLVVSWWEQSMIRSLSSHHCCHITSNLFCRFCILFCLTAVSAVIYASLQSNNAALNLDLLRSIVER